MTSNTSIVSNLWPTHKDHSADIFSNIFHFYTYSEGYEVKVKATKGDSDSTMAGVS